MPATLAAMIYGNAKNCCRKLKSFKVLKFFLQHFDDYTSKISKNSKIAEFIILVPSQCKNPIQISQNFPKL